MTSRPTISRCCLPSSSTHLPHSTPSHPFTVQSSAPPIPEPSDQLSILRLLESPPSCATPTCCSLSYLVHPAPSSPVPLPSFNSSLLSLPFPIASHVTPAAHRPLNHFYSHILSCSHTDEPYLHTGSCSHKAAAQGCT